MAAGVGTRVNDFGLNVLDTEADRLYICSAEPTTFTEASSTFALGNKTGTAGSICGSPTAATPNGRKVTTNSFADGSVTATGTASWWAIVDNANSRLLAKGTCTPVAVTSGGTFTFGNVSVTIPAFAASTTFTTLDPANRTSDAILSGGDLTVTVSDNVSTAAGACSIATHSAGKYYFEVTQTTDANADAKRRNVGVGCATNGIALGYELGADFGNSWGYQSTNGIAGPDGAFSGGWFTTSQGDVVCVAVDIDARLIWVRKNGGSWIGTGGGAGDDPVTGTNGIPLNGALATGVLFACVGFQPFSPGNAQTANFGNTSFTQAVPSGFTPGW